MNKSFQLLLFLAFVSIVSFRCTSDSLPGQDMEIDTGGENPDDRIVWTGADITFTKNTGTDPNAEANQDRLTDAVWITRGVTGGGIFNAKEESGKANKSTSPIGTKWAIGRLDDIDRLDFKNFRAAVGSPKNVVGKNLVLHLEADNIYLSVEFTSWSQGSGANGGGFEYVRSTP
ncbi:MAG: hypothetical protein AAF242_11580 [Bacteroidota bacterium]